MNMINLLLVALILVLLAAAAGPAAGCSSATTATPPASTTSPVPTLSTTTPTQTSPATSSTPAPTQTTTSASTTASNKVSIDLVAQNIAFNMNKITVPAGAAVTLTFNNKDAGVPHNFSLYTDTNASTAIFQGQIVTGPGTATYTFTAPTKTGTYFFRCDIHPTTMTGSLIVQ